MASKPSKSKHHTQPHYPIDYPSFLHCVNALCACCDGKVDNYEPVCFMPPFGWVHIWTKGNGHTPCAAARLWALVPEKLRERDGQKRF